VADFVVVKVAQGVEGLPHDRRGLAFSKKFVLGDIEKQFSALA